jgi:hypothetical protein
VAEKQDNEAPASNEIQTASSKPLLPEGTAQIIVKLGNAANDTIIDLGASVVGSVKLNIVGGMFGAVSIVWMRLPVLLS